MIIAYVGTPGSGKSYEAVQKILDNLRMGRIVFSNIDGMDGEFQREHIKAKTGLTDLSLSNQLRYLDNKKMVKFWEHVDKTPGALIVIDECHKLFSNRNWNSEENKKFTEWASTHRHGGYDVLLITQSIDKVDKHACSLIEWSYFYKKITHFGSLVKTKYRRYAYDSDDHNGRPIANSLHTYDSSIFPCYNSYDSSTVKELGIQKSINVLKHPIFYAIPIVFGLSIYFFSQSSLVTGDMFGSKAIAKQTQTAAETMRKKPNQKTDEKIIKTEDIEQENRTEIVEKKEPAQMVIYYLKNGQTFASNTGQKPPDHRILTTIKM